MDSERSATAGPYRRTRESRCDRHKRQEFIDEELCGLLQQIKKKCPNALCLAGGLGLMFSPETYLKVCDFVVRGEGEGVILDVADAVMPMNRIRSRGC